MQSERLRDGASKLGSNAPGHKLEIVVPSMGASFCLVRIPTSVAILFLLGRTSVVVRVPNACNCCLLRRRLLDLGRFLRRGGFGGVLSGKVLTAIAPKARPRLTPGLASGFHIIPLLAARFHCRRLRRRREGLRSQESKTWQRLKSERSRFSLDTSWMAVGAIKMAARLGARFLPPGGEPATTTQTLPQYPLGRHRGQAICRVI
jgi:hypothetical protein